MLRATLSATVLFALVLALGIILDRRFLWGETPCLGTRYLPATLFALLVAVEARRRWRLSLGWTLGLIVSFNLDLTLVLWLFFPACLAPGIFSEVTGIILLLMPVLTLAGWFFAGEGR